MYGRMRRVCLGPLHGPELPAQELSCLPRIAGQTLKAAKYPPEVDRGGELLAARPWVRSQRPKVEPFRNLKRPAGGKTERPVGFPLKVPDAEGRTRRHPADAPSYVSDDSISPLAIPLHLLGSSPGPDSLLRIGGDEARLPPLKDGVRLPERRRHELLDLRLPLGYELQRRALYPPDAHRPVSPLRRQRRLGEGPRKVDPPHEIDQVPCPSGPRKPLVGGGLRRPK